MNNGNATSATKASDFLVLNAIERSANGILPFASACGRISHPSTAKLLFHGRNFVRLVRAVSLAGVAAMSISGCSPLALSPEPPLTTSRASAPPPPALGRTPADQDGIASHLRDIYNQAIAQDADYLRKISSMSLEQASSLDDEGILRLSDAIKAAGVAGVKRTLKDPYTAQFDVAEPKLLAEIAAGAWAVCGLVNARNSYGGYVGQAPFYAIVGVNRFGDASGVGEAVGDEPASTNFQAAKFKRYCGG